MDMPLHAGGEQLLFLLFVLFSIVTALLERRKRKRQQEENLKGGPPQRDLLEDEEKDQETGSWPFPMGGDPFELPKPRARRTTRRRATEEVGSPPVERPATDARGLAESAAEDAAPRRTLIQELEDQQAAEEARARLEEAQADADVAPTLARFMERKARSAEPSSQQVQPRRRVQELVRKRVARDEQRAPGSGRRKRTKWALTPKKARDAVVYMEILGPPKGERLGEEFDR